VFLVAAQPTLLLAPDLSGTLVFALDSGGTAPLVARLDIVGGDHPGHGHRHWRRIIRDLLIGAATSHVQRLAHLTVPPWAG
jgi:hypothetical protein